MGSLKGSFPVLNGGKQIQRFFSRANFVRILTLKEIHIFSTVDHRKQFFFIRYKWPIQNLIMGFFILIETFNFEGDFSHERLIREMSGSPGPGHHVS